MKEESKLNSMYKCTYFPCIIKIENELLFDINWTHKYAAQIEDHSFILDSQVLTNDKPNLPIK